MSDQSFAEARRRMVRHQLESRGIEDGRVLDAIARIERERFVPADLVGESYADSALPIACGQTISQPYIVALMTQALELSGRERVLEIGTGSGYQAAVLAELAAEIYSIERHAELSARAGRVLDSLGYKNIHLRVGDGTLGWPEEAPFDRVIVTAAAETLPQALFDQLAEGGVLVMPLGGHDDQYLEQIRKHDGERHVRVLTACRFVPLVSEPS